MLLKDKVKGNIDPTYYDKLAFVESSNNPNAKAKTSSAAGQYQFIKSTWENLVDKYNLGYTLQDRFDPVKSKKVVELFTKENEKYLNNKLDRAPSQSELYLSHFLGGPRSAILLNTALSTPSQKVTEILPNSVITSNRNVFYNKDGSVKTAAQVYNWAANKFGSDTIKERDKAVYSMDKNGNYVTINPNTATEFEKQNSDLYKQGFYGAQNQQLNLTNFDGNNKSSTLAAEEQEDTETSKNTKESTQNEAWKTKIADRLLQKKRIEGIVNSGYLDFVAPEYKRVNAAQRIQQSYMQDGGEIKLEEEKEWLKNWYTNRRIENEHIEQAVQMDRSDFLKRLNQNPTINRVDSIAPNVEGRYDPYTESISITPRATAVDRLHEYDHYVTDQPLYTNTTDAEVIAQNIRKKDHTKGVYNEKYDYFTNPQEVKARIMNLRREAGFQPNQSVEREQLETFLKNYKGANSNINDLYYITPDMDSLLDILNNTVSVENNNNRFYAQDGGVIPVSSKGVHEHPNAKQIIVPTDGNITMEGVKYPIKGKSLETGEEIIMQPGKKYFFKNTQNVLETPLNNGQ